MTVNPSERREHRRYTLEQVCRVTSGSGFFGGGGEVKGLITSISKGGAAIRFSLYMEKPPPVGTPVNVYIAGVGDFSSKVMRSFANGFSIAFQQRKTWDKQLLDKLDRLLPDDDDEA